MFHCPLGVFLRAPGFLPQLKDMHCRMIGMFKLSVMCELVCVCECVLQWYPECSPPCAPTPMGWTPDYLQPCVE